MPDRRRVSTGSGGGQSTGLRTYGQGQSSAGPYGLSVDDEEFVGRRIGLIEQWAPDIAKDSPDTAFDFASNRSLDDDELMDALVGATDTANFERQKGQLEDMDALEARATYHSMPDAYQEKLKDLGYEVPDPGNGGRGFRVNFPTIGIPDKLFGVDLPGKGAELVDLPELGSSPDDSSIVNQVGGAIGSAIASPFDIAGKGMELVGDVSGSVNRFVQHAARTKYDMFTNGTMNTFDKLTLPSTILNPFDQDVRHSWQRTDRGEYYFREGAEGEVRDMVGDDFNTVARFAAGDSAAKIAEDEGLQQDTPEWNRRMGELIGIRSDPNTVQAITKLNENKISVGRLAADAIWGAGHTLGGDSEHTDGRGSTPYNLVSGFYDGTYNVMTDPTLLAGPVSKSLTVAKWGIRAAAIEDAASYSNRIDQILGLTEKSTTLQTARTGLRTANRLNRFTRGNRFARAGEELTRAVSDGTPGTLRDILRRYPEMTNTIDDMLKYHADELRHGRQGISTLEGYGNYWKSQRGFGQLTIAKVGGLRQEVRFLPEMSGKRSVYNSIVRSPAHRLMDFSNDLLVDDTWRAVIDNPEKIEKMVNEGSDILEWQQPNSFFRRMLAGPGRTLQTFTHQEPVNKMAIPLMSENATGEFRNLLSFGMYSNVPTEVRDLMMEQWLHNPTAAARGRLVTQFLDESLTRSGLRALPEGNELYDTYVKHARQIYGIGEDGEDLLEALYPDTQTALAAAIPDLSKLLGMTRYMSLNRALIGRLSHSWLDSAIGKVWKPMVVARIGFIPRAIGDELLGDLARHGPLSYLRTRALSMNFAQHGTLDALAQRGWESAGNKGWLQEHMARRFGVDNFAQISNSDEAFEFMMARPFQWMAHNLNRFARHAGHEGGTLSAKGQMLEDMVVDANFWLGDKAHGLALSHGKLTRKAIAESIGGDVVRRESEVIRRLQRHVPSYMDAKMRLGAHHLTADPRALQEATEQVNRLAYMRKGEEVVVVPLRPTRSNEKWYRNPLEHVNGEDANNLDMRTINGNLGDFYDALAGQMGLRMDDRVGQDVLREVMNHSVDDQLARDLSPWVGGEAADPKSVASLAQAQFDTLPDETKAGLRNAVDNIDDDAIPNLKNGDQAHDAAVDSFNTLPRNAQHFLVNDAHDNFLYGSEEIADRAREIVRQRLQRPDMAQAHRDVRRLQRTKDGRALLHPVPNGHVPMYGVFGQPDLISAVRSANPSDLRGNLIGRLQQIGHKDPERLADEIVQDFFPDDQFFRSTDVDLLGVSTKTQAHAPLSAWGTTNEDVADAVVDAMAETTGMDRAAFKLGRYDVEDTAIHQSYSPQNFDRGVVARGGRGHTWEDTESFQLGPERWSRARVMNDHRKMVSVPEELRQQLRFADIDVEDLGILDDLGLLNDDITGLSGDLNETFDGLQSKIDDLRMHPNLATDPLVQSELDMNEEARNILSIHAQQLDPEMSLDAWNDLRRYNDGLPALKANRFDDGASLSEIHADYADDVVTDLMHLVNHKRLTHEIINPLSKGTFDRRHLLNGVAASELPLKAYGPLMTVVPPEGKWSELVRYGFDKVIGPPIDSMVRSPEYIRSVAAAMEWADKGADLFIRNPELRKAAATVAKRHGQNLHDVMGSLDDLGDELLKPSAKLDDVARALKLPDLTGEDMASLRRYRDNWRSAEEYVSHVSNQRAVMELMNYIDDNRIRSYFQTNVRNLVPFHFAEEQFIKRWGRSLMMSPDAVRRGQLTMQGLRASGIIKEDDYGNQVIVYPMVGPAMNAVGRVAGLVWEDWKMPVPVTMTGDVKFLTPGFDTFSQGKPGFSPGPMVALPLWGLSHMFPELQGLESALTGRQGYNRDIWDFVLPTSVNRFVKAFSPEETQNSQVSAMQYMSSIDPDGEKGIFLKPDASAADQQEFLERAQNWSRVLGITRGILGFSAPASPGVVVDPKTHLTNAEPTAEWDPKFTEFMQSGLPLDEAIGQYLEYAHNKYGRDMTAYTVFGTKSKSGAVMPATQDYFEFMEKNSKLIDKFPYAAPWLGPQNDDPNGFNRRAYYDQIVHGLRVRKSPEEWIGDMHVARASKDYFDRQRQYQMDVLSVPENSTERKDIETGWEDFKRRYLSQHPWFKDQLESGEGRVRRGRILSEMRKALSDPEMPEHGHTESMRELVDSFDEMQGHLRLLKDDQRKVARQRKQQIKSDYLDYALSLVEENPETMGFFNSVIWPELGLEGNPFQTKEVVDNQFDLLDATGTD